MKSAILGIGTVSALGCGVDTLREGLKGTRSPRIVEHEVTLREGIFTLPVYTAEVEGLDRFIPRMKLRRMDRFLQMGLLASYLAIEDSGVTFPDRTRVGIVFGTGYGPLAASFGSFDAVLENGDKCASPTLFATSVHNAMASNVSIALQLEGPSQTLTCFEITTSAVFDLASSWLEAGIVDYVLAGVGDEYYPTRGYSIVLSGSRQVSAIDPFDFDRCSYLPGEGFAAFLLGRGEGYGKVTGAGRIMPSDIGHSAADILFLSASGERAMGGGYKSAVKEAVQVAAYAPLYGGMPVGQGFDLAVAAISLKDVALFPSPSLTAGEAGKVIAKREPLGREAAISTLQCEAAGSAGLVTLSAS